MRGRFDSDMAHQHPTPRSYPKMKSLRILLALAFAGILAVSVAQAGDEKGECKDKDAKCCCSKECKAAKDGKECADGKCCCAKKSECEKKEEKKA